MSIYPLVSEKAVRESDERRTYVFFVPKNASKPAIKHEVQSRFKVKVTAVNIARFPGKVMQSRVKRGGATIKGQRSMVKKAYVTLAEGQAIKLFSEEK